MQPLSSMKKALRRLEAADILLLILMQSALWIAIEKLVVPLQTLLKSSHAPSFGVIYLLASLLAIAVWLFWGRSTRLKLEHNWPLPWKVVEGVTKFLTHSLPEAVFEFFQNTGHTTKARLHYPLTMTFPAGIRDKIAANGIARTRWQGDTPSLFADLEWHFKNPNTMAIVRDGRRAAIGYFDFAPVTVQYLAMLRAGFLNEYDLADYMLPDDAGCRSLRAASVIYVAGLASVRPDSPWDEIKIGAFLHWSMARLLIKCVFTLDDRREVTFVAVAFGPGATFCERAGMRMTGYTRVDGNLSYEAYPVYEMTLTLRDALQTSSRLRKILDEEFQGGLSVDTYRTTPTRQIYILDQPNRHGGRP